MISRMEEYMIPYLMDKSLTKVRVHLQGQSSTEAFESYDCQLGLKSYAIIVLDLSKWEIVGLMSKSITIFGMYLTRPGMVHLGCMASCTWID